MSRLKEFLEEEGLSMEAMQPGRGSFIDDFIRRASSTLICGYDEEGGEHARPTDDDLEALGLGPGIDTSILSKEVEGGEEGEEDTGRDVYVDFLADPRVQPYRIGSLHLAILSRASVCCVVGMAVYWVRQVCRSYDAMLSKANKGRKGVRELRLTCFPRVAVVGAGQVGSAIAASLLHEDQRYQCTSLRQRLRDKPSLVVCARGVHEREEFSRLPSYGVDMTEDISAAARGADVVILALGIQAYEEGVHKKVLAAPLAGHTIVLLCCSLPEVAAKVRKDLEAGTPGALRKRLVHIHAALLDWHGWDGLERWAKWSGNMFGPGPVDALSNRKVAELVGEYMFRRVDDVATCTTALIENVYRKRRVMNMGHAQLVRAFDLPAFDMVMRGVMGHCCDVREVAGVLMPAAYDMQLLEPLSQDQSHNKQDGAHIYHQFDRKRELLEVGRDGNVTGMDKLLADVRDNAVEEARNTVDIAEYVKQLKEEEARKKIEKSQDITVHLASDNEDSMVMYPENLAHCAWRRLLETNNVQEGMEDLKKLRDKDFLNSVRSEIDVILDAEDAVPLEERVDPTKGYSLRAIACAVARDSTKFSPTTSQFLRRPFFLTDVEADQNRRRELDTIVDEVYAGERQEKGLTAEMFEQAKEMTTSHYGAAAVLACRFRCAQTLCQVTRGGRPVPWLPRNVFDAASTSKNPFG